MAQSRILFYFCILGLSYFQFDTAQKYYFSNLVILCPYLLTSPLLSSPLNHSILSHHMLFYFIFIICYSILWLPFTLEYPVSINFPSLSIPSFLLMTLSLSTLLSPLSSLLQTLHSLIFSRILSYSSYRFESLLY